MRSKGHSYTAAEFLELCAQVQADGNYIRAVDVVGVSGYRVKASDILKRPPHPGPLPQGGEGSKKVRCDTHLAQLWFDVLNAV